jgi:type II secretory pathway component GspD/PulD (secretin)
VGRPLVAGQGPTRNSSKYSKVNRKRIDTLWLTALLGACALGFFPSQAAFSQESTPLKQRDKPLLVNYDFDGVDAIEVIKILAKDMGRNVYIGPGVDGTITARFEAVTPLAALEKILEQRSNGISCKLIGYNTLVVATPEKIGQIEDEITGKSLNPKPRGTAIRQEFLLEYALASKVMGFLQSQYKEVEFIPHPTMNGFYAVGKRSDILRLKNEVPRLDLKP